MDRLFEENKTEIEVNGKEIALREGNRVTTEEGVLVIKEVIRDEKIIFKKVNEDKLYMLNL